LRIVRFVVKEIERKTQKEEEEKEEESAGRRRQQRRTSFLTRFRRFRRRVCVRSASAVKYSKQQRHISQRHFREQQRFHCSPEKNEEHVHQKRAKKGKNSEENFHLKSLVKRAKKHKKKFKRVEKVNTRKHTKQHLQQQQEQQQEL